MENKFFVAYPELDRQLYITENKRTSDQQNQWRQHCGMLPSIIFSNHIFFVASKLTWQTSSYVCIATVAYNLCKNSIQEPAPVETAFAQVIITRLLKGKCIATSSHLTFSEQS